MIKVNNIHKTFDSEAFKKPVEVLKGVSFDIKPSTTVGFLGANGAGKTTLMKLMMGFIYPTSGNIEFSSELGKNHLEGLKNIGYMPERPYFYPHLKGRDFIRYMGELSQLDSQTLSEGIAYWGDRFKITHALDRELKGYSKGMLQRIGFMAALVHDPKVIILDEPLSGLDPLGRKEFKDVIREVKSTGKSIFFSSHIVSDIEEVCDEVIFLKEGQIVFDGSLEDIYNRSKDYNIEIIATGSPLNIDGVKTEGVSSEMTKYTVKRSDKNKVLSGLDQSLREIISLNPIGQTLEEVFYFSEHKDHS